MNMTLTSDVHLCRGNGDWDNICPKKMVKRVQSISKINEIEDTAKICDLCAAIAGI